MADLFSHFVFEQPWVLAVVLAVAAAAVQVIALRGGQRKLLYVAPTLLVLAAATVAAGYAVETDREAVDRHTRALVAATAPFDRAVLDDLLADDIRLLGPDRGVWMSGASLHERLASIAAARTLDQRVVSLSVEPAPGAEDSGDLVAVMELRTRDASGVPLLSTWALHWRPVSGGDPGTDATPWELADVRWLSFANRTPDRSLIP